MILEIVVSALLAFVSVLVGGQLIMPILLQSNLVAQDINKKKRPMLPTSGGLVLALGFFFGILALVFSANYIIGSDVNENLLLLTLISVVAISFVGFMDDISSNRIRTSKQSTLKMARNYTFFNGGIKQWQKPLFTLLGAIPLMVINFGSPIISIPLLGSITINQIVYALVVIPLAMVFSSNAFNMLEGLNGISVQMGLVAFVALALFAYHIQSYTAFAVSIVFIGALLAYIYYGAYPAKILPGDSLTYIIGATFAATVIIGNMQILGLLLILPWLAEFILKARVRFHANSWGLIQSNGKLKSPHGRKIYSLTHLFLRTGRFGEWQIVSLLTVLEVIVASLSLLILW
jgi:UDP-N-acetylglucosamine--dolichyl-phosphate N-acetylglucosaminephosphotransferase